MDRLLGPLLSTTWPLMSQYMLGRSFFANNVMKEFKGTNNVSFVSVQLTVQFISQNSKRKTTFFFKMQKKILLKLFRFTLSLF